jgi:hypothetical protein
VRFDGSAIPALRREGDLGHSEGTAFHGAQRWLNADCRRNDGGKPFQGPGSAACGLVLRNGCLRGEAWPLPLGVARRFAPRRATRKPRAGDLERKDDDDDDHGRSGCNRPSCLSLPAGGATCFRRRPWTFVSLFVVMAITLGAPASGGTE